MSEPTVVDTMLQDEELQIEENGEKKKLIYSVNERPPVIITLILGMQAFMTCLGSTLGYPFIISTALCLTNDSLGMAQVLGTNFFVSGFSTILQTTFGIRLPILQSSSFAFIVPTIAMFSVEKYSCNYTETIVNQTVIEQYGGDHHRSLWTSRIREINGCLMVASLLQIMIGFSGILGFMLRFIGPLTIAPTISLLSLSLFDAVYIKSEGQWWIAVMTMVLIIIFSQYLKSINIPCLSYTKADGWKKNLLPIFNLFPILLALIISWLICLILTISGVFSDHPDGWGYSARTDIKLDVIEKADWFRVPYPGQWGSPTLTTPGMLALMAGVFVSMIESIGDYYACARLSDAPPPPNFAVNRGIGLEGICCLLAGAFGNTGGVTSYCENIGAIGITKVASRVVMQTAGVILVILGCFTKFSAVLITLPDPVVGGLFLVMFGMIAAVGVSNLQFVDLNSPRNMVVFGVALFCGLCIPKWLSLPENEGVIKTGSGNVDQIITVLLSTNMFLAGLIACILDNTIPGSLEERGMIKWRNIKQEVTNEKQDQSIYDLPLIQNFLDRQKWTNYVPFLPNYKPKQDVSDNSTAQSGDVALKSYIPLPDSSEVTNAQNNESKVLLNQVQPNFDPSTPL